MTALDILVLTIIVLLSPLVAIALFITTLIMYVGVCHAAAALLGWFEGRREDR